jgi:hypothetical protein
VKVNWRVIAICLLVSLYVFLLADSFRPTLVLEARTAEGARLFCSAIVSGDEIAYFSINSIFRAPVEERLRVQDDGSFVAVEVISTPDVIYYYGIESFTRVNADQVRAVPAAVHYRELRFKVGPRSQQRLVVRGRALALRELVPEAEVVILTVLSAPRGLACIF